jgi:predicted O-methyltransferase YrrM
MSERYDILTDLIKKINARKIAEVGVSRGMCARQIISKCDLDKYYMIDPDPHEVFEYEAVFRGYKHAIFLRLPSTRAVRCIDDGELDLTFIDADHGYESVKEDIKLWMPKIRKNGILCGHDYHQSDSGVIRAVDELLPSRNLETENDGNQVWWVYV